MGRIAGIFRTLLQDRRGSIALMGAMSLSVVLGMSAFAVEGAQGYVAKVRTQRVADMAALGAALAYKSNPSNTIMLATAQSIAAANGVTSAVTAATATDPSGKAAVQVTVATPVPLDIARVFTTNASYTVTSTAMASLAVSKNIACFTALSSTGTYDSATKAYYAVTLTGGTRLTGTGCAVATNSGVSLTNGTYLTAREVDAGRTVYDSAAAYGTPGVTTTPTANNVFASKASAATDTVGSDARLVTAFAKLGTFTTTTAPAAVTALANPTTPAGSDWDFSYSPNSTVSGYRDSAGAASYTVPAGTYKIGKLSVQGGISVVFKGTSTVTIAGGIANGGASLRFGAGTYKINGAISSGSVLTFGDGSYAIGNGAVSLGGTVTFGNGPLVWNAAPNFSSGGTYTFGTGTHGFAGLATGTGFSMGAGALTVVGPLTLGGGTLPSGDVKIGGALTVNSNTTLGTGNIDVGGAFAVNANFLKGTGAFTIAGSLAVSGGRTVNLGSGNVSIGGSVVVGGGSSVTTGAGTQTIGGASGVAIDLTGGSTLQFGDGAFSANGSITSGGGSTLVFGVSPNHLINGALSLNGSSSFGAGAYTINGSFTNNTGGTMTGTGVTFILAGGFTLSGGTSMTLAAPSSDAGGGITEILIATKSTAATSIGGGSTNAYTGVVYAPKSAMTLSGGSSVVSTGCFMIIVDTLALSGGATSGSACTSLTGTTSSTSVALVL